MYPNLTPITTSLSHVTLPGVANLYLLHHLPGVGNLYLLHHLPGVGNLFLLRFYQRTHCPVHKSGCDNSTNKGSLPFSRYRPVKFPIKYPKQCR